MILAYHQPHPRSQGAGPSADRALVSRTRSIRHFRCWRDGHLAHHSVVRHYYAPPHRTEALSDAARLTSVCLSRTSGLSREQKTKVGTEVAHVTRDSDTTFKVKKSKVQGRLTHRSVNSTDSCSGERENVLTVGTYCYVAVCTLQARSARRREVLRRPQREERGHIIKMHVKNLVILR